MGLWIRTFCKLSVKLIASKVLILVYSFWYSMTLNPHYLQIYELYGSYKNFVGFLNSNHLEKLMSYVSKIVFLKYFDQTISLLNNFQFFGISRFLRFKTLFFKILLFLQIVWRVCNSLFSVGEGAIIIQIHAQKHSLKLFPFRNPA